MSDPDQVPLLPEEDPVWTPFPGFPTNGGTVTIPEVPYGQQGWGDNGYDTPTLIYPTAGQPLWSVYLIK